MLSKLTSLVSIPEIDLHLDRLDLTAEHLSFLVVAALVVFLGIEARLGRPCVPRKVLAKSYRTNLATFLFNDLLLSMLSVSSLVVIADQVTLEGLLSRFDNPLLNAALTFVLLDLTLYWWHRSSHSFDWLWTFHKVHHSDLSMNTTTAFRLHIVEVFLTTVVKALFVLVSGASAGVVLASEAIIALFVLFHHTNIAFSAERWLKNLLVVPRLHRVHHSARREEHDHNFGAVFSIWDRLFGTLKEMQPAQLGLRNVPAQDFWELFKYGFASSEPAAANACLERMIAEAAYYRAEKRGFTPGAELRDWYEAEREIQARRRS